MKTVFRLVLGAALVAGTAAGVSAQGTSVGSSAPSAGPAGQAPAPPAAVVQGPYNVFFDFKSSELTPDGRRIVDDAADVARKTLEKNGAVTVHVAGHTDTWHDTDRCMALSGARADAVRDELVRKGVEPGAITVEAKGKTQLLVDTGDRVQEPQNRRASILVK